jgi:hypothetical protein
MTCPIEMFQLPSHAERVSPSTDHVSGMTIRNGNRAEAHRRNGDQDCSLKDKKLRLGSTSHCCSCGFPRTGYRVSAQFATKCFLTASSASVSKAIKVTVGAGASA